MLTSVVIWLLLAGLVLFCEADRRRFIWMYVGLVVVTDLARIFGRGLIGIFVMNWEGKIIAFLISCAFVIIVTKRLRLITPADIYVQSGEYTSSKKSLMIAFGLIIVSVVSTLLLSWKQDFSLEQVLFQMTVPGLDEELISRGIGLGLLNLAFPKKVRFLGTQVGIGFLVIVLEFALSHALYVGWGFNISFNLISFIYPLIMAIALGLMAESTKSIVLPTISHNVYNTLITVISMLR